MLFLNKERNVPRESGEGCNTNLFFMNKTKERGIKQEEYRVHKVNKLISIEASNVQIHSSYTTQLSVPRLL